MKLIDTRVKHKAFGEGIIIGEEDLNLTIKFENGEKKFQYPDCFYKFITAVDSKKSEVIRLDIERRKKLEEEEKQEKARIEELERQNQIQQKNTGKNKKKKVKVYSRENIAFKCNFCDGGKSDKQIGYNGVCSDSIIQDNIEVKKRSWCSSDDCACLDYLKGDIDRSELDSLCSDGGFVCYESQMLRDWRALAGIVQIGERKGQPMKLHKVQKNSLCILTTRDPVSTESERYIFGVFLVDETYQGDSQDEGYVTTKSKYRIKLSPDEARKMLFWNYHANDNRPEVTMWSSGLHRYFEDEQAVQILKDVASLKQGTDEEKLANEFVSHFAKINGVDINSISEKNGALKRI